MNPLEALAVLWEARRRFVPRKLIVVAKRVWRFLSELHPKQRRFHDSPSKRKAALCSRRAGKSWVAAASLIEAAGDHPDSTSVYIALTREQARRIMWRELKRFNDSYSLGIDFNETKLVATLPNRSEIVLLGALNEADIDRIRGVPFVLAVIDEAASFPVRRSSSNRGVNINSGAADKRQRDLLERMFREVLQPTMLDYQGTVMMLGTPAAHCDGFFFEVTHPDPKQRRKGWDVHTWTVLDNPHVPKIKTAEIPDAATWLKQMREEEQILETDPSFLREWLAKWVRSAEALVYEGFHELRNVYKTIPNEKKIEWFRGVSVDLGYDDPTVIGVFQWSHEVPDVYLTRVIKKAGMIPAQIAATIKQLDKEFGPFAFVVVDQGGGAGKMIAEEFTQRYKLPNVKGAEKTKKPTFIQLLNGDLKTGRFKIHEDCLAVLDEISVLQWDPRYMGAKEDERFANDACDMMLYGWRECRGYDFDQDKRPAELDPDDAEAAEDEMEQEVEKAFRRRERDDEDEWFK